MVTGRKVAAVELSWEKEQETQVVWSVCEREEDRVRRDTPGWEARVYYDDNSDCWTWWARFGDAEASGSIAEGDWDDGHDSRHPEGLVRAQAMVEGAFALMRQYGEPPA